jgi:ribosomal protein S18 acetylase RimI-like enzyme
VARERPLRDGVPRKLALLDRGRGVFGSYAKVLLVDDRAVAYCQFGPLSAYPRASHLRELYPQLPEAPLPAVITCIATTADARRAGHAKRLVQAVCDDLTGRGFSAVEAYPDLTLGENEASGARPGFWHDLGFATAVDDERYPVMRREL